MAFFYLTEERRTYEGSIEVIDHLQLVKVKPALRSWGRSARDADYEILAYRQRYALPRPYTLFILTPGQLKEL
jgi:hypothetical protein